MSRRIMFATGLAFLAWEAWGLREFLTRPAPDEEMQSVAALMLGGVLPALVLAVYGMVRLIVYVRRKVRQQRMSR